MALVSQRSDYKYTILIWKIEEDIETLKNILYSKIIDKTEYQNIILESDRLGNDQRKKEWLTTRILYYQSAENQSVIRYFENKKPYIADNSYFISISHSREWIALIVSKIYKVGIDIEYVSERIFKIQHKFLNHKELQEFGHHKLLSLLAWSAKETIYKILGNETVDFKNNISIIFATLPTSSPCFFAEVNYNSTKRIYKIDYQTTNAYVLTSCRLSDV